MPNDHSFQKTSRPVAGVMPGWLVLALSLTLILPPAGCDKQEKPAAIPAERDSVLELSRQLETERSNHTRTMAVVEAERAQTAEDFRIVSMILASTGIAMVILVLLLARQRRSRRILERLLRMLLNRLHRAAVPPAPPINRPSGPTKKEEENDA